MAVMNAPEASAGFSTDQFRQTLATYATGVCIAATRTPQPEPGTSPFTGLTIGSFGSVSLTPPLVLWSLAKSSSRVAAFQASNHYIVNVLAADQRALCERFAYGPGDRFAGVPFQTSPAGLPIIDGALSWFECRHRSCHDEGDHLILVGEVTACGQASQQASPLVFHQRNFATIRPLTPASQD